MMPWLEKLLTRSPIHNNVTVFFAMIMYYRMAVELACWMRFRWDRSLSRPVLHFFLSSLVLFWPYFDRSDWSWRLNALVPAIVWTRLIYKGAVLRDPSDPDVQNISLSSNPSDLLFGPAWSTAIMVWIGNYLFMTEEAAIVAAIMVGDGLAPLIGSQYGRHIFQMPISKPKSMEGTVVGVFLGTVAGSYFYLYAMGIPLLPLRIILAYAAIAAVAEATAPGNLDNVVAPVVLHFSMERVQQLIPA